MSHYWFASPKLRSGGKLALVASLLAFVVILLGAYTRLTDAGLSCPDWPNCYGYLTAPHTSSQLESAAKLYPDFPVNIKKAWTEMTHRYVAGFEGILILLFAFSLLFSQKAKSFKSTFISISLISLLILQVALGMLTVTEKLKPLIVLSHLMTGLSLLSILWWGYLELSLQPNHQIIKSKQNVSPAIVLGLVLMVLQITLGGWVSSHYAGLACVDFPYCNGLLLPKMQLANLNTDLITIHMLHRFGAILAGGYLIVLSLYLTRIQPYQALGALVLLLVSSQILLGIMNVLWLRPIWIALLHHGIAIILLMTLIMLLVKSLYCSEKSHVFWVT